MFKTFPNVKIALLVGIGGGVPRPKPSIETLQDVHVGDVVVGWPGDGGPAVVYYDSGRSKVAGVFEMLGTMNRPEWNVTQALGVISSKHILLEARFKDHLSRLKKHPKFAHPGFRHDRLFKASYHHIGEYNNQCMSCDLTQLVQRPPRTEEHQDCFVFHQGRIATGNSVIQDGERRDQISKDCSGVLCIEMEAAGVDVNKPCLVIRGISDYADSHKDDVWKFCAAANAAAFARELLLTIPSSDIKDIGGNF
jgi:nucleoside phosphorylase